MGGHPWQYFVSYQANLNKCLQDLREREFAAGRYNPAERFPIFPVNLAHRPGAKHPSIAAARKAASADGTRSILDVERIADRPDFFAVAPLDEDALIAFFGTAEPTRADIEANDEFLEDIERGQGVYIVAYENGEPCAVMFAGYSFD